VRITIITLGMAHDLALQTGHVAERLGGPARRNALANLCHIVPELGAPLRVEFREQEKVSEQPGVIRCPGHLPRCGIEIASAQHLADVQVAIRAEDLQIGQLGPRIVDRAVTLELDRRE